MKLQRFADEYCQRVEGSAGYRHQLAVAVRAFSESLRRPAMLDDLCAESLNAHLAELRAADYSDSYRKGRKTNLLVLWNAAADDELIAPPRRRKLLPCRVADRVTTAWTRAQVTQQLLPACQGLKGQHSTGVARADYWRAWILCAWDSALRGVDLRRLKFSGVASNGRAVVVQHKTGKRIVAQFTPTTMHAIDCASAPRRELVFPLWGSGEIWRREAARLIALAGLRGSIGMLRASTGTDYELRHPGRGHELLGNTRAVFEKHYLDLSIVESARPAQESLI
ncbi:MAG: hypothetical protein JSS27_00940 [Planctomycetes bacterium]|nr:hypothetical protein [Planctomycetota bacterium]